MLKIWKEVVLSCLMNINAIIKISKSVIFSIFLQGWVFIPKKQKSHVELSKWRIDEFVCILSGNSCNLKKLGAFTLFLSLVTGLIDFLYHYRNRMSIETIEMILHYLHTEYINILYFCKPCIKTWYLKKVKQNLTIKNELDNWYIENKAWL